MTLDELMEKIDVSDVTISDLLHAALCSGKKITMMLDSTSGLMPMVISIMSEEEWNRCCHKS